MNRSTEGFLGKSTRKKCLPNFTSYYSKMTFVPAGMSLLLSMNICYEIILYSNLLLFFLSNDIL